MGRGLDGSGGVGLSQRQSRRNAASPRMVIPIDLWRASSASFYAPSGSRRPVRPRAAWMAISATMSQWRSWETAPQRADVFLMLIRTA